MKVEKVFAVYFSGTGTTKQIVNRVAKELGKSLALPVKEVDFTTFQARKEKLEFNQDDLVVIGVPVYAGRVPNLILPYIKTLVGNGTMAVPIVLYGNRNYDDALIELKTELENNGFETISAGAFIGEHSFSKILATGRPDNEDLKKADTLASETVKILHHILRSDGVVKNIIYVKGNLPLHPYYTPRDRHGNPIDIRKVKPKTKDSCTNCGRCVDMCPMNAIESETPDLVSGICIKCCACIKRCPQGAKYFDDERYIYHMHELEELYGSSRKEPELFLYNL